MWLSFLKQIFTVMLRKHQGSAVPQYCCRRERVVKNGSGHIKHCNVAISLELTCKLD